MLLASAVALVALGHACRAQSKSPYKTMKLPNGLEVVVIENQTVPLVTVDIAVRNGAFTEPDDYAGLSHLYEHMFFKANAAFPSQEAFMKRVRELGIVFNGYTSQEVVTYYFTLPSRNLELGMRFMADAIKTPKFNEDELVKEREVVLGEFDRNEAQPTFALNYAIDSAMWMPYVSRKQPLGQRMVIKTATVEKMRLIKDLFYLPNNSALIVSGAVKAADVFALAKKYFADWKAGHDPFPDYSPPAFPPLVSKLVMRESRVPDVDMRMVFRGPSEMRDEPDPYTATLLSVIVNQATSRFYRLLIDSGLATNASLRYSEAHNVSTIGFWVRTTREKARPALDLLKAELAAMSKPGYFTADEIAVGKRIVADQEIYEQDNPQSFAIGTTAHAWSATSLPYYLGATANVRKVTAEQLSEFVRKYLLGRPMVLGVGAERSTLAQMNFTEEALKW